jgi:hypothetical protein
MCHGEYFNRFIQGLKDFFGGKKYGNIEKEFENMMLDLY